MGVSVPSLHRESTDSLIIDNSKEVLDRLRRINETSQAKVFDSYDFATLYIIVYLTSPEPSKNCYNLSILHPI